MSGNEPRFLLDANIFIEAKNRYYGLDFCPGFWKLLCHHHSKRRIFSIDHVFDELLAQNDELADWAKDSCPASFFKKTQDQKVIDELQRLVNWVYDQGFRPEAKSEFASVADGWVIAYAKANSMALVTQEEYAPDVKKRVPIPNVCVEFDVPYVNTFEMLRHLGAKLDIPKRRRRV